MVTKFKKVLPFFIVILLTIPAIWPLLAPGFFPMHDDTQPSRVFEMAAALKNRQLPVRWVANLGYGFGYPIFNFYSPLPYYVGAFFALTGLNILVATKIMFGIGIILSGVTMFMLGKKLYGNWAGLLVSSLYVYAPYHAVQIYVRGSVGEYWAYALLPLICLGILHTKQNKYIGISLGSISFACVILSHNITAFILAGFLGLFLSIELVREYIFKKKTFAGSLFAIVLGGLTLSAFFWLPATFESSYTRVQSLTLGSNDFHNHFVFLDQLWNSSWGYAGSASGRDDGMSFKIGRVHIAVLFLAVGILLYRKIRLKKNISSIFYLLLSGFALSLFFMVSQSQFIWEIIPGMSFVQYPWRFLVFLIFFLSLAVGLAFQQKERFTLFILGLFIVGAVAINVKYFQPQYINSASEEEYTSSDRIQWNISKISDEYLPKNFPIPQTPEQTAQEAFSYGDAIIVDSSEVKTSHMHAIVSAQEEDEFIFSLAFFPGWKFVIDGQEVKPLIRDGLPVLNIPPGRHIISAYFADTWVRTTGNTISLIGLLVLGSLLVKLYAKK